MALAPFSVNHRFPSGPEVMPPGGQPFAEDTGNSVVDRSGRCDAADAAGRSAERLGGCAKRPCEPQLPSGPTVMRPAPL